MIHYMYSDDKGCSDYKKNKISLGCSDGASLIMQADMELAFLNFGIDEAFTAWYITDSSIKIPSHYNLVATAEKRLKIYDDTELMFNETGSFEVYRAGEMDCIIRKTA